MEIFATATFPETIYIGLNQTFWIVDNVRITLLSDHHWSNGKLFCQADFAAKPNNPTHLHLQQSFSYPDPNRLLVGVAPSLSTRLPSAATPTPVGARFPSLDMPTSRLPINRHGHLSET
jgi:hypothetical protein